MEKAKKKPIKKYISWALIAALVLGLAVMPLMAQSEAEEDGPVASILSGTVELGSVNTTLHGGGTLEAVDEENVTIPSGVKITEFLVKNGDTVTEGTPIAAVDKVSVMTAIIAVTESMEYLQDEMESARNETAGSTIAATAGGRVKEIYAEAGDSVQDVILEHGALAVLSLDSMMAVKIEREMDILTGENVCVTLSDDTEVSGRVESNLNGEIVITVEDEGYAIGEKVTVTTGDGDRVGSGELHVHNEWKATAFTGTVSTVNCKEESTVYSGSTLFTLTDTEFEADLNYLVTQHREYEELMQELFRMYESGTIDAPCDGIISGVDKDSAHLLAAEEAEWQVELLSAETRNTQEKGWKVVLLGNVTPTGECPGDETCTLDANDIKHQDNCPIACTRTTECTKLQHYSDCPHFCDRNPGCDAVYVTDHLEGCPEICTNNTNCQVQHYRNHVESCPQRCQVKTGCTANTHLTECPEDCKENVYCKASRDNHTDKCPLYCSISDTCTAKDHFDGCPKIVTYEYIGYVAVVDRSEPKGNVLYLSVNTQTSSVKYTNKWDFGTLNVTNPSGLTPQNTVPYPVTDASQFDKGDIVVVILSKDDYSYVDIVNTGNTSKNSGSNMSDLMDKFGGMGSGMAGMMGGLSGYTYGGITTDDMELFDLEGDVLVTVTPQNEMTLPITLDEQDISRVAVGMTAQVKVGALRGETFEGTVTNVGISGTNNGGSSKFTVEIRLNMTGDMIPGMSATAVLPLETVEDVPIVPVAALVEDAEKTVICTGLDEETGEPANAVEVTTGISDGENVEILSGLEVGDTFYYSYYDTLELSTEVEAEGFSFGR